MTATAAPIPGTARTLTPTTAHRTGAGLGLSIVRSVAHAHGGSVAATANPGGGLRVTVKMPVPTRTVVDDTTSPQMMAGAGGGD